MRTVSDSGSFHSTQAVTARAGKATAQHPAAHAQSKTKALIDTAMGANPVEAGRALRTLDAGSGGRRATDRHLATTRHATALPPVVQNVASWIGSAVDGTIHVARDLARTTAAQAGRIADAAAKHPNDPAGFVNWLTGPQAPSFEDWTAQVPGLQKGIGDVIDGAMANPVVSGVIGKVFGFEYQPGVDFYTTGEHSIQSMLGFHDMYDSVGKLLGMDLDDKVMEFAADGIQYRVELWKGGYGNGGAFGGEIGIYTRGTGERGLLGGLLEQIPGYYSSANGDSQIRMTQEIYNKETGEPYFSNPGLGADGGPGGDHFWNLAIRTDPGVRHEDLGQRGTLEMDSVAAAKALCAEMNRQGAKDGSLTAEVHGTTVSYVWE